MKKIALGLIAIGLLATPAWADDNTSTTLRLDGALKGVSFAAPAVAPAPRQAAPAPAVTGVVGVDFPTAYFFRGFKQEADPKFTMQPFVDIAFAGESASFNIGSWNSIHTGSLDGFYESDIYAAVTVGKLKATYTGYLYPEDQAPNVHELMLSATVDHVLAPSFAVAFEFAKEAGLTKGVYFEAGIAPAVPMEDGAPVSITVPVKVGLSLKDYYGEDVFGYFSAGVTIGHSLNDRAEIHGGVTVYALGEAAKAANNGKAGAAVGSIGLSVKF